MDWITEKSGIKEEKEIHLESEVLKEKKILDSLKLDNGNKIQIIVSLARLAFYFGEKFMKDSIDFGKVQTYEKLRMLRELEKHYKKHPVKHKRKYSRDVSKIKLKGGG